MALADDLTRGDIQSREYCRRAVSLIVVRLALRQTWPKRQDRLCAIQRLDLALFVHAQHNRLVRRIQVQPHDVTDFGRELRIGAELERLNAVRLQVVFAPNALYGRWAQSLFACHRADAPMRGMTRLGV